MGRRFDAALDDTSLEEDADELEQVDAEGDTPIEADPETVEKLKKAGLWKEEASETPAKEEETQEEPTEAEQARTDGHPEAEAEPQPEYIMVDGQKHPVDSIIKSWKDRQGEVTRLQEEVNRTRYAEQALMQLTQDPEGMAALARLGRGGQPRQPERVKLPETPDEFADWIAANPQKHLGLFVNTHLDPISQQMQQQQQILNSILTFLETKQMVEQYGDLSTINPYMEQLNQKFGPNLNSLPMEMRLLMAKGLANIETQSQQAQQQVEQQQTEQAKQAHREKAIAASVESAAQIGKTGHVVNIDKMNADERRKYLTEKLGVRVVDRD